MKLSDIQKQAYETADEKGFHDRDHEPHENARAFKGIPVGRMRLMECLMLIVTEVAEAAEDVRHNRPEHFGEELADIIIRVVDTAAMAQIDIELEVIMKMAKNKNREKMHGGKAC